MNCQDCRFWEKIPICTGGICRRASWAEELKDYGSKAHAIGPSGHGPAALVTAPDFGCVQFEAKP